MLKSMHPRFTVTTAIATASLLVLLTGACKSEQSTPPQPPPPAAQKAPAPASPVSAKQPTPPQEAKAAPAISEAPATSGSKVQGTVQGKPFTVRSSMAGIAFGGAGGGVQMYILSDTPDACGQLTRNEKSQHARRLSLQLSEKGDEGAYTAIVTSGTFRIEGNDQDKLAAAWFTEDNERCEEAVELDATSGEIVLGEKEGEGTFSLTFKNGDQLRGKFHASDCAALSQGYDGMMKQAERPPPTCK